MPSKTLSPHFIVAWPGRRDRHQVVLFVAVVLLGHAAGCAPGLSSESSRLPTPATRAAASSPAAADSLSDTLTKASGPSTATAPSPAVITLPTDAVVAWMAEGDMWVARGSTPAARLVDGTPGDRFVTMLAPDGRHVAGLVARAPGFDLDVIDVSNGTTRTLVSAAWLAQAIEAPDDAPAGATVEIDRSHIEWLPDGAAIAFTTEAVKHEVDAPGWWRQRDDLWIVPLDGGDPVERLGAGQGGHPSFAPDGSRVAVSRVDRSAGEPLRGVIAVADMPTGDALVLLTHDPVSSGSDWTPYNVVQWSSDSRTILVAVPALTDEQRDRFDGWADFDDPFTLLRLVLDGTTVKIADAGGGSVTSHLNYSGRWSPDTSALAYLAPVAAPDPAARSAYPPPTPGRSEAPRTLVIARGDGAEAEAYDEVASGLAFFSWAPDGSRFVYRAFTRDHGQHPPVHPMRLGRRSATPIDLQWAGPNGDVRWLDADHLLHVTADGLYVLQLDADGTVVGRGEIAHGAVELVGSSAPPH